VCRAPQELWKEGDRLKRYLSELGGPSCREHSADRACCGQWGSLERARQSLTPLLSLQPWLCGVSQPS